MNNPCYCCHKDLGAEPQIVAINGFLMCQSCASENYSADEISDYGELVVPSDIGIEPESCYFCPDKYETEDLVRTNIGVMCHRCLRAIRSRGELVEEV